MKSPNEGVRESSPDAVIWWEVQRFVRPYQSRLEIGTREMALLNAIRIPDRDDGYRARADELRRTLAETQAEFDAESARDLSANATRHSIVRDIKRAFERLQSTLAGMA